MEPTIVTPARAASWIMRQAPHHHDDVVTRIERLAGLMRGGYWVCDGTDPVTFDTRGTLVDGRCRMAAVVLADVPVMLHLAGWHFGPHEERHDEGQIA